jgi:DNA-binding SARP family transcriptional activator
MAREIDFCLLGPLAVRQGGAAVRIQAAKQRVVLAALLLHAGQVVALDELAELVWGSGPPVSARITLQNYARRLRLALGDTTRSCIATMPEGYQINVADGELDVNRFVALQREARHAAHQGAWDEASAQLSRALALWRGEPLADIPSDVLRLREQPRLVEMHSEAQEDRVDADLHLGRHRDVIAQLRELAAAYPLRERRHEMLMLALYRDGRRAEALAAYHQARQMLVGELGVEPGTGLCHLHQRILSGDPGLLAAGQPVPGPERATTVSPGPERATTVSPGPGTPQRRTPQAGSARRGSRPPVWPPIPRQLPATVRHFAGRQAELKALAGLLDEAHCGAGTVAISAIGGTAGIGKTTLALHFAHQVADRFPDGQLYVNLRGFGPSGEPMTPAEGIRGFLEALHVPPDQVPANLEAQAGLYRSLMADKRILILLDNAASTAQVRPLLPASPGCLVLVTSRRQLGELAAVVGAHLLTLDVLTDTDSSELLARRLGPQRVAAEPRAVSELISLCDHLPLALASSPRGLPSIPASRSSRSPHSYATHVPRSTRSTPARTSPTPGPYSPGPTMRWADPRHGCSGC